ncbi:thy-1 membrane glycoprotein [Pimephales promelas]|nr:thy-1 membrane glycoprotein [Pimephales promelas]
MSLTNADDNNQGTVKAHERKAEGKCEHYNPFLCDDSCTITLANGEDLFAPFDSPAHFSPTNPFCRGNSQSQGPVKSPDMHIFTYPAPEMPFKGNYEVTKPFAKVHMGNFVHSTPAISKPEASTFPMPHSSINPDMTVKHGHFPLGQPSPSSPKHKSHSAARQPPLSDSDEDYNSKERVPTLRPGQYDGSPPWREFLHRFESCAEANHWSVKTMAIQLKFCLTGAAGAIVHRNPRSSKWDNRRLLKELETAYGPSSDHAAVVAVELRQRVRKSGEALHVFRDDIYEKVSIAYGDWSEAEQDAIAVEVFTNGLGDAELVQRLLEKRPATLAKAYEIDHRHDTTKRAASYVTSIMQPGARNLIERRPRAAVVRERDKNETVITTTSAVSPSPNHFVPRTPAKVLKQHKNFKRGDIRCYNCNGWGHKQSQCSSPQRNTETFFSKAAKESPLTTVFHLKSQSHEMNIHMRISELVVCAVLDSGARRSVLPLHQYNAIHQDVRPPLQSSIVETLLGVGPGEVPVLGEAKVPVSINNRQVVVDFLVADIEGNEVLLGHPFLTQAEARLDFGKHRIILFGEEVPYFHPETVPKSHAVRVARTVVVEAGQKYLAKGNVYFCREAQGDMMLSPTKGFVEKHRVLIARALVNAQATNIIPLRFFNPGNKAETIKEGAIAGLLQPVEALSPSSVPIAADFPVRPPAVPEHLQELYAQSSMGLNGREKLELSNLLCAYESVFSMGPGDLGRTSLVQHDIITRPGPPVKQSPRRMAGEKQRSAEQQISEGRHCHTQPQQLGLADRYDTLDTLATAKWFSSLDLAAGYWQVELTPRARRAAAFCTRNGLFECNVMPFGLCNAPATFQRLMDRVLAGLQGETCLVYLDDIIVLAKDVPEMLQRLSQVFQRLKQANLKLKPAKCCLFRRQVFYLGHIVSEHGVATDPNKVSKVQAWPTPTSVQEVRRFIGLASYYRRFVKDFASIAEPLHNLTKKNAHFQWHAEHQAAFDTLKHHLTTAPVLGYPLDHGEMILDTDASDTGTGAVLSQMQGGTERVLAYGSRKLTKAEQNYCTTRRELLAIVDFTSHFRQYLLGRPFQVRTDHSSLRWLTRMKEPEGQLARWLEKLVEYEFEIVHRPGRFHTNADSLSRRPCRQSCPCNLQDPSLQLRTISHQAIQCDLDSDTSFLLLSPVGVSAGNVTNTDSLKQNEDIYVCDKHERDQTVSWLDYGGVAPGSNC